MTYLIQSLSSIVQEGRKMRYQLSSRAARCQTSALRQIFDAIDTENVISFAGGLPGIETFKGLEGMFAVPPVPGTNDSPFQYGSSCGEPGLRRWIAAELSSQGLVVEPEQIIVLSGSQQGIDLVAKLTVDEGTCVAVEYPTYLAALQAFTLYGAHYLPLTCRGQEHSGTKNSFDPKSGVVYVNPTFSNPTGQNLSARERKKLAKECNESGAILIEDDPYRELYYTECDRRPVCADVSDTAWVYLSSFSKTVAPGLRIGYMAVSPELLPSMVCLKQAADLHTARMSQTALLAYIHGGHFSSNLGVLREHYRVKRDSFHQELSQHWSDIATWELPQGGMFFWLTLKEPPGNSLHQLLDEAVKQGVAFMPGSLFYPENIVNSKDNRELTLRLNFTCTSVSDAARGLSTLRRIFDY